MIGDNLTKEEIANLSLEMRCCYFLYPWNNSMTGTTVEEWAERIGFVGYNTETSTIQSDTRTAIHEANELIALVKDDNRTSCKLTARISVPDWTHELTQFSWKLKELDGKVDAIMDHTNCKGALVEVIKSRDERIDELYTRLDENDGYVKTLEAKIIKQSSYIKSMANLASGKQDHIDELNGLLKGCREAKQDLQGVVDTRTRQLEIFKTADKLAAKTIDDATKTIEEQYKRIGELEDTNKRLNEDIDEKEKAIEELEANNKRMGIIIEKKSLCIKGLLED